MAKVLIAVPTFESIYSETYKSIWDMDKGEHECIFDYVKGYDCASARNNIVQLAKGYGVDYVMMVDSDVIVPKDALINLISHGVDVCSGYYLHRNRANDETPLTCLCKMGELNYTNQYTADEVHELCENGGYLFRIHGGGMGCVLIKMSVFERIAYPWYDWVNYTDPSLMLSEDLHFCELCKAAHIKIFADSRVACGHIFRQAKFA